MEPGDLHDNMGLEEPTVEFVKNMTTHPLVLLKHHYPFDFQKHGVKQPTLINVIRDPG